MFVTTYCREHFIQRNFSFLPSVSTEEGKVSFQQLNDSYKRILDELDRGNQQSLEELSRPVYRYDPHTDLWQDQCGHKFKASKAKINQEINLRYYTLENVKINIFVF